MSSYAVIGYRRTGKDTLCSAFQGKRDLSELGWKVYSKSGVGFPGCPPSAKRVALADELKYLVCDHLNLDRSIVDSGEFDRTKDTRVVQGKTLRQWCIDLAHDYKRQYGKLFFVDTVSAFVRTDPDSSYILTDCRYPFEVFPGWVTIRLFRKEVPIPPEDEDTERTMDSYPTDFLFVKDDQDYQKVLEISPQYKDYRFVGTLC